MRQVPTDRDGAARIRGRHIYVMPTRAGLLFALVLFVTLAGSLNYQNNLGLLLTFVLGSVALVSLHLAWFNLLGLEVRAGGGDGVFAGDDAYFTVTLRDPGHRPRADLIVGAAAGWVHPIALARGAQEMLGLAVATTRRGPMALGPVTLETRFPLGLFRAWCVARSHATTLVYPRPTATAPQPLVIQVGGQAQAQGDRGEGADDFIGPRVYQPGDSPRRLDWKALARERGLVTKQFGGARTEEVWLDWEQVTGSDSEARLSRLCRQVIDAGETRTRFGLRLPGRIIPVDAGETQRQRCLEALATFDQDPR